MPFGIGHFLDTLDIVAFGQYQIPVHSPYPVDDKLHDLHIATHPQRLDLSIAILVDTCASSVQKACHEIANAQSFLGEYFAISRYRPLRNESLEERY